MSVQIAIRIPEEDLAALDEAVERGAFESRAEAVRTGVEAVLRAEREREIGEEYRRAYEDQPQEAWVGETGLALGAELVERERGEDRGRS